MTKRVFFRLGWVTAALLMVPSLLPAAMERYSHGNPSADEQFMLELTNRARANPADEGLFLAGLKNTNDDVAFALDFFDVNMTRLKNDFAGYDAEPPLAFNAKLLASSDRHSADMAKKNFQDHIGSDGSTFVSRIQGTGYNFQTAGENIFSLQVPTVLYAHAGLNIDWGNGADGLQSGVSHRKNIMNFTGTVFREVGIGVTSRSGTNAAKNGKLSVVQDFGIQQSSPLFLLGVAYYDVNKNGLCDPGEGIPNIKVLPDAGSFYAMTSASGGYAIPFATAPGAASVTFSGGGLASMVTQNFSLTTQNVKADLRITSGLPFVYLQAVDSIASEKSATVTGRTATFRVVRVGPTTAALKVGIIRPTVGIEGTALPKDYKISAVSPATVSAMVNSTTKFIVTIPKGKKSADINLVAIQDSAVEPTEKVSFTTSASSAYLKGSPSSVTLSITK